MADDAHQDPRCRRRPRIASARDHDAPALLSWAPAGLAVALWLAACGGDARRAVATTSGSSAGRHGAGAVRAAVATATLNLFTWAEYDDPT